MSNDPRKTASILSLQEQMIETRAWKKIKGMMSEDMCWWLAEKERGSATSPLRIQKSWQERNMLKDMITIYKYYQLIRRVKRDGLPEYVKWHRGKWNKGDALENDKKKLYWD